MERPKPPNPLDGVNWDEIEYVVGTREDVSFTGMKRRCSKCGHNVFFRDRGYPRRVPVLCDVCFGDLPDEEILGDLPADLDQLNDAQLIRLCQRHNIRGSVPIRRLRSEAKRRNLPLKTVARERLLKLLKDSGVVSLGPAATASPPDMPRPDGVS